jgi:CheY-like chemotaxis protein
MTQKTRILVADDRSAIRFLLTEILTSHGYEVVTAADGVEALGIALAENFDLVLMDLIMPRKDGIETMLALRTRRPLWPIIAMSGGSPDYLPLAGKIGARRILAKPFDGATLIAAVENELGMPQRLS